MFLFRCARGRIQAVMDELLDESMQDSQINDKIVHKLESLAGRMLIEQSGSESNKKYLHKKCC